MTEKVLFDYICARRRDLVYRFLAALIAVHFAVCAPLAVAAHTVTPDAPTAENPCLKQIYENLSKLILEFYPKAKVVADGNKIHFEYKAHPYTSLYNNLSELAPDNGGILGDVELKPGPYTGAEGLPHEQNQYRYTTLLMAPYSPKHNCQLSSLLSYPPDTISDFIERYKELINNFDSNLVAGNGPIFTASAAAEKPPVTPATKPGKAVSTTPVSAPTTVARTPTPLSAVPTASSSSPASQPVASVPTTAAAPQPVASVPAATPATNSSTTPTTTAPGHRIFLWKATRGKEIVYLLGTIHVATAKLYPLPVEIDQAFDQSKLLIVEVAIDRRPVDPAAIQKLVQTAGTYTPPDKLSKHMSLGTRKIFEDYLTWSGETWAMFEQYKPWYVRELTGASMPARGEMREIRGGLGIDRYLLGRAKATHKDVGEFETVDFQLGLFSRLPEDVQDKLLQVSLLDTRNAMATLNQAFAAWKDGDPAQMSDVATKIVREHPDLAPYNKILLDDRNKGMAARLEEIMKTKPGPYFVAVGSAHMVGDTGLVTLLKKQGFTVEQVCAQNHVGESVTSASTANLRKFAFPTEKFRVWMPAAPQRKDLPGAEPKGVQYMFAEFGGTAGATMSTTFGMFAVFSFAFPTQQADWRIPGPLALDMMLGPLTSIKGAQTVARRSITLNNEYAGREVEFIAPTRTTPDKSSDKGSHSAAKSDSSPIPQSSFASDLFGSAGGMSKSEKLYGKARAYLAGSHIYLLITAGDTPDWTKSQKVEDFLNSFDVIP